MQAFSLEGSEHDRTSPFTYHLGDKKEFLFDAH